MNRNRFHALCPYFAMFPESFAERWIAELTSENDLVLDPFSGRGTTAFCALTSGRRAIASDLNNVAYCLTLAKSTGPSLHGVLTQLGRLENKYEATYWVSEAIEQPEFFHHAFDLDTLAQILYLRHQLKWRESRADAMIAALALGSLHGEVNNAESYFSNQMPRTISTKPAYSIKFWNERGLIPPRRNVFKIIKSKALFRYESALPDTRGLVLNADVRRLPYELSSFVGTVTAVITSPPYFDTTNFEEDQWLRLWMLGGPPNPGTRRRNTDDRHADLSKYWSFISDMWRVLGVLVRRSGHVVIRIGSARLTPDKLASGIAATSVVANRRIQLCGLEVSEIRNRQTDNFRPGTSGCLTEVDCIFQVQD